MKNLALCLLVVLTTFLSCRQDNPSNGKIPGSYRALELFSYQRAYPDVNIPDAAYAKAFEHHKRQFLAPAKNLNNISAMGPLNTSGRTLTVAINPQSDSTIYAGSASGGLWRSRSLGLRQTWEYVETGFPILGVSTIEFAPNDSLVMYIGTGEVYNYEDTGTDGAYRSTRGSYGFGILKSIDGGVTWEKSLDWSYNQKHGVWMIKVSPTNPNKLYAATTKGIYKSVDAGEDWELVFPKLMATDIDIDPRNDDILVACFGNLNSDGKGLFRSIDGGENWTEVGNSSLSRIMDYQGKVQLARAPSNPDLIYGSVGNGFGNTDGATQLIRSINNGISWEIVNELDYSKWQGWFAHDVAIDPNDEDNIITVGIEVYKSTDGGYDLRQRNEAGVTGGYPQIDQPDGPPDYVHSDIHFVTYHTKIKDLVLFGTDGGVFLSFDNGRTFRSANGGMQTTQFYNGFTVSKSDGDFALGGLQDNSTVIFRGDETWQRAGGGDGSWTGMNQQTGREVYLSAQYLYMLKSEDFGNTFNRRVNPRLETDDDPLFISPYIISDSEPNVIYVGSDYVYKSTNSGESYSTMNSSRPVDDHNPIFAMAVSSVYSSLLCVATAPENGNGKVLFSVDGGSSWTGKNTGLPDRVPNDIVISDIDPNLAFVCYSGFGTNHLFVTRNLGQSWAPYDMDLPDAPGNAIAIDEATGVIYFGTDIAVYSAYYKTEEGDLISNPEWNLYSEGMPLAAITLDLKISPSDNKLWIATHGNGTYRGDLVAAAVATNELSSVSEVNIYPNPTSGRISLETETSGRLSWRIFNTNGRQVMDGDERSIDLSGLISGSYFIRIKSNMGETTKLFTKL